MMKLSTSSNIHIFDLKRNYAIPMEKAFSVIAESGYTHVDAAISAACRPGQPLTEDGWISWAHRMRECADREGLTVSQTHCYWAIGCEVQPDGTRPDGSLGEMLMERSIVASGILGASWTVVHPLNVKENGVYDAAKSFEYNRAYYTRWAELAEKHRVGIAIENMPSQTGDGRFCVQMEELNRLIDAISMPNVGACLDTGHAHLSQIDPADAAVDLGSRLKATHIADNHQNRDEHFAPCNGTINWAKFMAALRKMEYSHDFAFEIQNLASPYPAAVQPDLVRFSYALGKYLFSL